MTSSHKALLDVFKRIEEIFKLPFHTFPSNFWHYFFFFDVALLCASSPERGGGEEPGGLAVVVHVADGADGVRDLKENFTQN